MKRNSQSLYWQTNDSWYEITSKGKFALTKKAPKEARKSFRRYKYGLPLTVKRTKIIIESYFIEAMLFLKNTIRKE